MKKVLLTIIILCFAVSVYAQDNKTNNGATTDPQKEDIYVTNQYIENTNIFVTKTQNWILISLGGIVPSTSFYDSYFTFGATIGGQFSRFFATELSIDYLHWQGKTAGHENKKIDTADLKTYLLFQPIFTIKDTVALMPHFGIAPLYSFHEADSVYNTFGYAMKIGIRVNYKYMLAGFKVEYSQRNMDRSGITYAAEVGITF